MSKKRKRIELGYALDNYFSPNVGQIPIMIVDTSTIIDLEEKARGFNSHAAEKVASALLTDITKLARYIVIPKNIFNEIEKNHRQRTKNSRPLIGKEIYNQVLAYIKDSREFVSQTDEFFKKSQIHTGIFNKLKERLKELNGEINYGKKGKKIKDDPMSEADMNVMESAIKFAIKSSAYLESRIEAQYQNLVEGTYRVAVLSGDSHIYRPLKRIIEIPEGLRYRDYILALNTRAYS